MLSECNNIYPITSFDEVRALVESKPDDKVIAGHPLAIKLQADYDTTQTWKTEFKNSMPHVRLQCDI